MNGYFAIIKRFKMATTLNLLGLVAALTACYVLRTQVEFVNGYNSCINDSENVYRLELFAWFDQTWGAAVPRPLIEELKQKPEVDCCFLAQTHSEKWNIRIGEHTYEVENTLVDGDALRLARLRMLCGVDTLSTETEALLPASLAKLLFGETMVVGRDFLYDGTSYSIVGVFEDFPLNCLFANTMYTSVGDKLLDSWINWNQISMVRLREGTDPKSVEDFASEMLTKQIKQAFGMEGKDDESSKCKAMLRPATETYTSGVQAEFDQGNAGMTLILNIASWLLLFVAAINFANFSLAETPMRIKGINTRKVLGMSNGELRRGMILETVLTAFVAFLLSLGAAYLLGMAPWIQSLIVGTLALDHHLGIVIYLGVAAVIIGALVGLYPAFYATSFPPALVLKGSFGLSPKGVMLRKTLVFLQLLIATIMLVYLSVLQLQSHFIFNSDYGFNKDEMLFSNFSTSPENLGKYEAELEKIPGVESVCAAAYVPGISGGATRIMRNHDGTQMNLVLIPCDWKFLRTIGIEIMEGRDFAEKESDVFIVNETAKQKYQWLAIDRPLSDGDCDVIGICRNFRVFTAREDNASEAVAFLVCGPHFKDWRMSYRLIARVGKNIDKVATKRKMEQTMDKLIRKADYKPEFRFMDDQLQQSYEEELRFVSQVKIFSLLSLLITLIGIFCLTMFETEYRRKEIGIRKVLGSTSMDIILLFCRRYVWIILLAFALAAPLAYLMSEQWLQNFAERTPIHWWLWPATLATLTAIVLLTVGIQTWRTAHENPVNSIKTE